jgi:hypothetical protein
MNSVPIKTINKEAIIFSLLESDNDGKKKRSAVVASNKW